MDVDAAEEAASLSAPALIYLFVWGGEFFRGVLEGPDERTRLPDVSWFLNSVALLPCKDKK